MKCVQVRRLLPGYLDGALPDKVGVRGHARVGRHLENCPECRSELQRHHRVSMMMAAAAPIAPPEDLGVRVRVAVSRARAEFGFAARMRLWKTRAELMLKNILEPLALPAAGGVLAALVVFVVVYQVLGAGVPLSAAPSDLPTSLLQPARLEMLANFQMSGLDEMASVGQNTLLVEATVNAAGEAVSYRIISGPVGPSVQRGLDQILLFSRFRPQMSFGRPTSGGRVILSFSRIRVRG
jgi:anti-sigma factor RsiW